MQTILITGAARGIGKSTAIQLAARGYKVFATTHTKAQAKQLSKELKQKKIQNILVEKLDITKKKDRAKWVKKRIDILINNAAIGESGSLAEVPMERVRDIFETNLFSLLELTQIVIPSMVKRGEGRIVMIGSLAGRMPMEFMGPYCMTKFSLGCAATLLRKELRRLSKGIRVVLVTPGAYHTGFNQRMVAKKWQWMEKSLFSEKREDIKKQEDFFFRMMEKKRIDPIVKQVVKAATKRRPRRRYAAPWLQEFGSWWYHAFT